MATRIRRARHGTSVWAARALNGIAAVRAASGQHVIATLLDNASTGYGLDGGRPATTRTTIRPVSAIGP